ncbi:Fe-S cluster assembly sulfur transfer protein SufU [Arsenicicoccus cauae]|uniref:SUF system NifU family Fe-S cluster assembly protein n=1 Tax=Arsenicicoccus cauae TaxID=2663847 RepID=A0A6I3IXG0_9MICO|nr:SUF system NifU family Fe-S cluster assembly protein [Arsenicicoccus cauae]MTB72971.1 SUF system NifU family Fe-S cluster assembly protein [Arsenicicoccus cauae]
MDLYQELILDHSKRPRHPGLREPYEAEVHHVNPTCGDEVTLRVHVDHADGAPAQITLQDVSYDALGCSISMASTSVLAEECIGRPLSEVFETYGAMRHMLTSKGADPGDEEVLGDGVAFAGVAQYPARVKCALLGWTAMVDALAQAGVDISSTSQTSKES